MSPFRERTRKDTPNAAADHLTDGARRDASAFAVEDQVGFLVRAVSQRNTVLFAEVMVAGLTRVQFTTIAKLLEIGSCSQNELGRLILMDRATIKGVVNRLRTRGFIRVQTDPHDRRQHVLSLSKLGRQVARRAVTIAPAITEKMLEQLNAGERKQIVALLRKIVNCEREANA